MWVGLILWVAFTRAAAALCLMAPFVESVVLALVLGVKFGKITKRNVIDMAYGTVKSVAMSLRFGLTKLKRNARQKAMDSAMNVTI